MIYRDKFAIIKSILLYLKTNMHNDNYRTRSRTRVMYYAELSNDQTKVYLNNLINSGLIEFDNVERRYSITEKGLRTLDILTEMQAIAPGVQTYDEDEKTFNEYYQRRHRLNVETEITHG